MVLLASYSFYFLSPYPGKNCYFSVALSFFGPVISGVGSLFLGGGGSVSQAFFAMFRLMITRKEDSFDYKVYHESGRKVLLGGKDIKSEMDSSQVVLEKLKIKENVSHSFSFYGLDGLFTEEEINEAIRIMSGVGQSIRHIHVELRTMLGDNYAAKYPKYGSTSEKLPKLNKR